MASGRGLFKMLLRGDLGRIIGQELTSIAAQHRCGSRGERCGGRPPLGQNDQRLRLGSSDPEMGRRTPFNIIQP